MTLRVYGTYKHRTRVKILWFWWVTGWQTDKFDETVVIPDASEKFKVGPVTVKVGLESSAVNATVLLSDIPLFNWKLAIPGMSTQFHAEPIKGCIVDATLELK